jgi:hypothetical protein
MWPEPLLASTSNRWPRGTSTVTCPEEADSRQSDAISPSM